MSPIPKRQFATFAGAAPSLALANRHRPLVSIVLPVYNHAALLKEAVASVLNQQGVELELIVLDDGSQDNPKEAIQEFLSDRRLRFYQQDNRGLSETLNRGFTLAQGAFWTWTSADNRFLPDALQHMCDYLLSNPAVVLTYANVELIDEAGELLRESSYRRQDQSPGYSPLLLLPLQSSTLSQHNDNFINACFLYRRVSAELVGNYRPESKGYEDYEYWLKMQQIGQIAHIDSDQAFYQYRLHNNSLTAEIPGQTLASGQQPIVERFRRLTESTPKEISLKLQTSNDRQLGELLTHALQIAGYPLSVTPVDNPDCVLTAKLQPDGATAPVLVRTVLSSLPLKATETVTSSSITNEVLLFPRPIQIRRFLGDTLQAATAILPPVQTPRILKRARDGCLGAVQPAADSIANLLFLPQEHLDQTATERQLEILAQAISGSRQHTWVLYCDTPRKRGFADTLNLRLGDNSRLRIIDASNSNQSEPLAADSAQASLMYAFASCDALLCLPAPDMSVQELLYIRVQAALAAAAGCNLAVICERFDLRQSASRSHERLLESCLASTVDLPHLELFSLDEDKTRVKSPEFLAFLDRAILRRPYLSLDQWLATQSIAQLGLILGRQLFLECS